MKDQPWRIGWGLAALLIWSVLVGLPVVTFHVRGVGLMPGEHLHAAILFVASQLLVFWVVARPKPRSVNRVRPRAAKSFPSARSEHRIWQAELASVEVATESPALEGVVKGFAAKVCVDNYVGSSKSRRVSIDPEGSNYILLPGNGLEVTAVGQTETPSFRIVESDLATQVFVLGLTSRISVAMKNRLPDTANESRESPTPENPAEA